MRKERLRFMTAYRERGSFNKNTLGFTLIELMMTVAIVAILSAVGYPAYTSYIQRSSRVEAQSGLIELAQFMEQYHAIHGNYVTPNGPPALPFNRTPKSGSTIAYHLSVSSATSDTYTLQAVPNQQGPQAGDYCGTLTLKETGEEGASHSDCWSK